MISDQKRTYPSFHAEGCGEAEEVLGRQGLGDVCRVTNFYGDVADQPARLLTRRRRVFHAAKNERSRDGQRLRQGVERFASCQSDTLTKSYRICAEIGLVKGLSCICFQYGCPT